MTIKQIAFITLSTTIIASCAKPDSSEQQIEKAKLEATIQAQAEFDKQMAEKDNLLKRSREEAKAAAEEDFKVQLANQAKLIDQARQQGRAQSEEQLSIENGNLSAKAQRMESDLAKRHRFYQSISGTYEGQLTTEQGNFNIRITLVPSLSPYAAGRTRQLEEITADINNLFLNAQIVQWSSENQLSSVGCRVTNVRPDLINGTISIASPECSNIYLLSLSGAQVSGPRTFSTAKPVVAQISKGKLKSVPALVGEVRPTTNAAIYQLFANRKGK